LTRKKTHQKAINLGPFNSRFVRFISKINHFPMQIQQKKKRVFWINFLNPPLHGLFFKIESYIKQKQQFFDIIERLRARRTSTFIRNAERVGSVN
jgi:hypothetical protein